MNMRSGLLVGLLMTACGPSRGIADECVTKADCQAGLECMQHQHFTGSSDR